MTNVMTVLRDLVPIRALTLVEALRIAELQAMRLLELTGIKTPPVPETIISGLPRIQVERIKLAGLSGAAEWSHGRWLIVINGAESRGRQRFSLAHEFKHVLDNPFIAVLYPPVHGMSDHDRAEQICDYFAGCFLMPRQMIKREWGVGMQDVASLARRFAVSRTAVQVRLLQIGLSQPYDRDNGATGGTRRPYRRLAEKEDAPCQA
jgi:Zn-dependent peptidase ImmA (M78 family)